jgi:glycosyltransferase involved in cell wall biosynthesis
MVGISLLTLVPGLFGGSETYARELVRALARVGRHEYRVFLPTLAPDAADGLPARTVTSYRASLTIAGRSAAMAIASVHPQPLRRELDPYALRALHFPLTVMIPRVDHPPAAATILDLQHELLPRLFSPAELAYRRVFYRAAVRRSRIVIAISHHVEETLVSRLRVEPDRVRVAPLGVDRERFSPAPDGRERQPILLYPANAWRHKNHRRLFDAFALVRVKRPELRLVLTGAGHEKLRLPPGVETRGRLPEPALIELYRSAAALVFPSLYEGFGQPPLEAMACGCPVAASDTGALPEVCGDAARYFDPSSPESIAEAITEVLANPEPWVSRGLRRAASFDWDETARRHDDVYEELGAGGPGR